MMDLSFESRSDFRSERLVSASMFLIIDRCSLLTLGCVFWLEDFFRLFRGFTFRPWLLLWEDDPDDKTECKELVSLSDSYVLSADAAEEEDSELDNEEPEPEESGDESR